MHLQGRLVGTLPHGGDAGGTIDRSTAPPGG